ncbi:MAG: DUF3108 domain-containing protein [Rhodomicrobium sp.]
MRLKSEKSVRLRHKSRADKKKNALAAVLAFCAFSSPATAEVFLSRYAVSVDGLHVGEVTTQTVLDAKRYKVGIFADVGVLLSSTQIRGEASGIRSGAKLTPEHFQIAMSGGDQGTIDINFANSTAAAANGGARLKGFFDPLSALLAASLKPASPSNQPCNLQTRVFTGRERLNLSLHPKAEQPAPGEVTRVFCQAILSPVEGSASGQEKLKWEIMFTKVPKPHFWLVEHISFPAENKTVTIDRAETSISGS